MSDVLKDEIIFKFLPENSFKDYSDSDSSSSISTLSSDEEEPTKRRKLVRIDNYIELVVRKYSEGEFKACFRMNRCTAYKVVIDLLERSNILPSHLDGREKISSEKAFLMTLWYMSNEETFRQVSDRFNVTISSAHRCLTRIIEFLLTLKSQIIQWPTEERANSICNGFRSRKGIDNVLGAIDGSHIEIPRPKEDQESYVNRKGYHSLLLQGIVDHEKRFIDVFCGEPGSIHDARLLRKSAMYAKMHRNPNFLGQRFLLGDSAYPNLHWLVTPFKDNGTLTRNHKTFNFKHSSTRVVVENAFGLLKGRFRRLRHLDNLDLKLCTNLIMVACILHNICIMQKDVLNTDEMDYNQPEQIQFSQNLSSGVIQKVDRQQQVYESMFSAC